MPFGMSVDSGSLGQRTVNTTVLGLGLYLEKVAHELEGAECKIY